MTEPKNALSPAEAEAEIQRIGKLLDASPTCIHDTVQVSGAAPTRDEDHLGDGVYAVFDGYGITLDLRMQDESRILIEPYTLQALIRFARRNGMPLE